MSAKTIVTVVLAGCAAIVMSAAPGGAVQMPHPQNPTASSMKPASGMPAECQAMMAEHEKMMTDMKAADERLDDLVAAMNAASGMEKMAATSTVVTEMVTQRRTMRDGMMKMQQGMMGHMMEHMQAAKGSMAMCPMMMKQNMKH